MALMSDLTEIKTILEIDPNDTSEDKKLLLFLEWACALAEEYLNRTGRIFFKSRTEYYSGSGTQQLLLRSRPVYTTPTIQVFVDDSGYYGTTSGAFSSNTALTYGSDFSLIIDQDDGTSRSGILLRTNSYWPRPPARARGLLSPFLSPGWGNVKVVYSGGYTIENLPALFRQAIVTMVAKMAYYFPLGMELASESYEERHLSHLPQRDYILNGTVKSLLMHYRNWIW